jgi:hypothetical protein
LNHSRLDVVSSSDEDKETRPGEHGGGSAFSMTGQEPVERKPTPPEEAVGGTCFGDCPFHESKERDRHTTCQMNLALVQGLIEGINDDGTAGLGPEEGCCWSGYVDHS